MRRWLTCFAEHLRDNRVREWTWWDLPRQVFTSVKGRLLARCLAALVTAALGVVAFGICTRVFYVLADDAASRAIFSASILDILTLAFLFGAPGGSSFASTPSHVTSICGCAGGGQISGEQSLPRWELHR
jgi:hypothetical protein